ncbi:MAG: hypothetical protein HZC28_02000 [Spirochaetes bacterium]|nr:hypothetical protein [Spirochaetota bacterium]
MKTILFIIFPLLLALAADGQTNGTNVTAAMNDAAAAVNDYSQRGKTSSPINGFRSVQLGQTIAEVVNAVYQDRLMLLPQQFVERDMDIQSEKNERFININENKFFKSGYFLFRAGRLYSIRLAFSEHQFTFLDLHAALTKKYGAGKYKDNNTVIWSNSGRELVLERPSIVKYFNRESVSNVIAEYGGVTEDVSSDRASLLQGL